MGGALSSSRRGIAELLSSTRGKLLEGEKLVIRDPEGRETQKIVFVGRTGDGNFLFRSEGNRDWLELLEECGRIPLPPYIRDGQMTAVDRERYQTVYARNPDLLLHQQPDCT